MRTTTRNGKKRTYFETSVSTDVDVTIDADDLHDDGWHHETECAELCKHAAGEGARPLTAGLHDSAEVIGSLHRQAHPGQPADPFLCRQEPCRSLSFDQVAVRLGRAS